MIKTIEANMLVRTPMDLEVEGDDNGNIRVKRILRWWTPEVSVKLLNEKMENFDRQLLTEEMYDEEEGFRARYQRHNWATTLEDALGVRLTVTDRFACWKLAKNVDGQGVFSSPVSALRGEQAKFSSGEILSSLRKFEQLGFLVVERLQDGQERYCLRYPESTTEGEES